MGKRTERKRKRKEGENIFEVNFNSKSSDSAQYLVRAGSLSNPLNATYDWIIPLEDNLVQYIPDS